MGSEYHKIPFGTTVLLTSLETTPAPERAAFIPKSVLEFCLFQGESHSEAGGVGGPSGLSQKPDVPTEAVEFVGVVAFEEGSLKPTLADQREVDSVPRPLRFRMK
jgi:hypothetical protein